MDYDNDGDIDVLSGSYTGEIYYFERGEDGKLAQGRFLIASDGKELKTGTSVTPEAVDVDDDGDLDLVIGTRTSGVFVVANNGTRERPVWAPEPAGLRTAKGTKIKGSNAHHADWDGDGIVDLVLGSEWGDVVWHRNLGKSTKPRYAEAQTLVDIRSHRDGQLNEGDLPARPGSRTKVHVTDWNGDGQADLLVGDVRWAYYELEPLTAAQEAEKAALKPAYDGANAAYRKIVQERNDCVRARKPIPDELKARMKAEAAKIAPLRKKWYSFKRRRSNTHGWVWLYLRGGKSTTPASPDRATAKQGPVALKVSVAQAGGGDGRYELTATVTTDPGWHIYASVPANSQYPATTPSVALPRGTKLVADWTTDTADVAATDSSGTTWFEGEVVFRCTLQCSVALKTPLDVTVELQACDARTCMPPATLKASVGGLKIR